MIICNTSREVHIKIMCNISHPFIIVEKIEQLLFWKRRDHTFNDECSVKSDEIGYIITWKIYYNDIIYNFDNILQVLNIMERFTK